MDSKRSLSHDDNVPDAKKQRTVIKAFDVMRYNGIRPRPLYYVFKVLYVDAVISAIHEVQPDYVKSINTMPQIWDQVIEHIDRSFIHKVFHRECRELSQPAETYDFEQAYKLAETEWRIELMLAAVEIIIKSFDDSVPLEAVDVVVWDVAKQVIVIDRSVCRNC